MKTCSKCKEIKSFGEFRKDKTHFDGHRSACKVCMATRPPRPTQKFCGSCEELKSVKDFHKRKGKMVDWVYAHICIECKKVAAKEYHKKNASKIIERACKWGRDNPEKMKKNSKKKHIKKKYGITLEELNILIEKQNNLCAICQKGSTEIVWMREPGKDSKIQVLKTLDIDHNHKTGLVRQLLCGPCNRGAGQFKDSSVLLRAAARYIDKHNNLEYESDMDYHE